MQELIILVRNDTAATGDIGAFGRRLARAHRVGERVEAPLLIGTRDESALGVPAGNPGVAVVEAEKAQMLGFGANGRGDPVPAASLGHFVFEEVAMEDAAVDHRLGKFLIVLVSIAVDQMPSMTGDVSVDAGNGAIPVLFFLDRALDSITALKPIDGTEDGAKAEEEVWGHDG